MSLRRLAAWLLIFGLVDGAVDAAPPITAAAFTADGKQVVLGSQSGIEFRSWPDLKLTRTLKTDLEHVHDLAFSPDGQTLIAAGGAPAEAGEVEFWSWPDGRQMRRIAEHEDLVYRVAWSADGKHFVTAGADGICQVFAADTGRRLVRYEGHSRPVLALCYLPDGKAIVSAGADQTLRLWDSASGKHLRTLDNHVGQVNDVAARPHRASDAPPVVVSVSEDRTVRLWQPTIGRLMRFAKLPSIPRVVAWSPDGNRLLVGCNDGHLRTLDAETTEVVSEKSLMNGRIHALAVGPAIVVAGENAALARSVDPRTDK